MYTYFLKSASDYCYVTTGDFFATALKIGTTLPSFYFFGGVINPPTLAIMVNNLWLVHVVGALVTLLTLCLSVKVDPMLAERLLPDDVSSQSFDLSLRVRLNGTGFHRTFSVTASSDIKKDTNTTQAPIRFLLRITKDVYVDVDQLNTLEEFGAPQMTVSAHMDTEQPVTHSSDHWLLIHSSVGTLVSLPLHLRYQSSSVLPYKRIAFPYPLLFMQCSNTGGVANKLWPPCGVKNANLSCNSTIPWCSWVRVAVSPDLLELDVPCGLEYHTFVVVPVTISVTLVGAIYIIQTIKYVHISNHQ